MLSLKETNRFISVVLIVSTLFGCAGTYRGEGIAQQETTNINSKYDQMKRNAKTVGIASAIGGGIVGGSVMLWYGLMENCTLASTLGGAALYAGTGAIVFGVVGAVIGGSVGYYYIVHSPKPHLA